MYTYFISNTAVQNNTYCDTMLGGRQGNNGTYSRPQKQKKINTKLLKKRIETKLTKLTIEQYCQTLQNSVLRELEVRAETKVLTLTTATTCGGSLFQAWITRTAKSVPHCRRILILESGQYNLRECPLVETPDSVKNSAALMFIHRVSKKLCQLIFFALCQI